jgi:hypothetical protein
LPDHLGGDLRRQILAEPTPSHRADTISTINGGPRKRTAAKINDDRTAHLTTYDATSAASAAGAKYQSTIRTEQRCRARQRGKSIFGP